MDLIERLRKQLGFEAYSDRRGYGAGSLWRVVRRATGCWNIYVPDRHLDPISWDEIRTIYHYFSKNFKTSTAKWVWYDCDDQARNFWNYARNYCMEVLHKNGAIAYVWTVRHALCLFVDEEPRVHFVETYTGEPTVVHARVRFVLF